MATPAFFRKTKDFIVKWWKWMLRGFVALTVIYAAWRLRRQAAEIARLRADIAQSKELIEDLEVRIRTEKNAALAKALQEEVVRIEVDIARREADIKTLTQQYDEAKKKVDAAKNWKDLDAQAKPK